MHDNIYSRLLHSFLSVLLSKRLGYSLFSRLVLVKYQEASGKAIMLVPKQKKKEANKCLITVSLAGSTISYKLVVKKEENVEALINKVLRFHHQEGRLPTLGFDASNYMLYPKNGVEAPKTSEKIGLIASRSFELSKKLEVESMTIDDDRKSKVRMRWKEWVKKTLSLKVKI